MEFTELKMIWDSQNQEPLYAINEAALHRVVLQRSEEWRRRLARCFLMEITAGLVYGVVTLVGASALAFGRPGWLAGFSWIRVPVLPWDSGALFLSAAIWLYYSAYMYLAQRRQQRRESVFDTSLRGAIERSLAQTRFQIALARDIVWWGLVPNWIACGLWVGVLFHLKSAPLKWVLFMGFAMIASLLAVVYWKQRAITNRFEPRQRELESLRAKLTDPQP